MSNITNFDVVKISNHALTVISDLDFNAGGISLENFSIAIDSTIFPATGRLLREQMELRFGLPVKFLFLTHYHGDHLFGFSSFSNTAIIASEPLLRNHLNEKKVWPTRFEEWKKREPGKAHLVEEIDSSLLPSLYFQKKLEIRDNDFVIKFHHTGGHTSCSAYAYFPREKVLFAGDLIFAKEWPWAGDPSCDPDQWIAALQDIMKRDFEILIPGHGPVVGKVEVEVQLELMRKLREETKNALGNGNGVEDIRIPPFYEDKTPGEWVKKDTVESFYKFYKNKLGITS